MCLIVAMYQCCSCLIHCVHVMSISSQRLFQLLATSWNQDLAWVTLISSFCHLKCRSFFILQQQSSSMNHWREWFVICFFNCTAMWQLIKHTAWVCPWCSGYVLADCWSLADILFSLLCVCLSVCAHSFEYAESHIVRWEMYSTCVWKVENISVRTIYRWNLCFIGFLTI